MKLAKEDKDVLTDKMQPIIKELAKDAVPNPLLPPEQLYKKVESDCMQEIVETTEKLSSGLTALREMLGEILAETEVLSEIDKIEDKMEEIDSFSLEDLNEMIKDQTFAEICELSPSFMTALYDSANEVMKKKDPSMARDAFYVLTAIDPKQPLHWLSLGNAELRLQHFNEALMAYQQAHTTDPTDLRSILWAAYAYEFLGQAPMALQLVQEISPLVKDHEDIAQSLECDLPAYQNYLKSLITKPKG